MKTCLSLALVSLAIFVMIGCKDQPEETKSAGPEALPAGLIVDAAAPADAKDVSDVRNNAKDGEGVVVRGRIGGSKQPFVEGRAAFQLVDLSLATCDKAGEMHSCATPWDYCCDESGEVFGKSVAVRVVGPNGQPLRAELNGVGGMKPKSEVAVKGKIRKGPDGKAIGLDATELYVLK